MTLLVGISLSSEEDTMTKRWQTDWLYNNFVVKVGDRDSANRAFTFSTGFFGNGKTECYDCRRRLAAGGWRAIHLAFTNERRRVCVLCFNKRVPPEICARKKRRD